MARSSFQQPNFLGGEWSSFFQGRAEHPKYRTAMNVCRNGYPVEEGPYVRRSGTRLCAPTFKGQQGKVYPFYFSDLNPYTVEFTDGNIRFFNGVWPVITEEAIQLASLSTANPAVVTLNVPAAWATGDEIVFYMGSTVSATIGYKLRQRTFLVTAIPETYPAWSSTTTYGSGDIVTSSGVTYMSIQIGNLNKTPASNAAWWTALPTGATRTYSIADAVTGVSFDGSTESLSGAPAGGVMILRILRVATLYTAGSWATARIVQNEDVAVVLNGTHKPQFLTITPNASFTGAAAATCVDLVFQDGPYLDAVANSQATMGGSSGVVSMSVDFITWSNTTTYAAGDYVKYGTSAYKSLVGGNLNNQPDINPTDWKAYDRGVAVTGPNNAITGFQNTDVGRLVRLFSEPATWVSGGYVKGNKVKWNDVYYLALNNNSAEQPDLYPADWTVDATGANWTWGQITSVTNSNSCQVQIMGDPLGNGSSPPINTWRLGVYSDTTGYPTCGIFCEGRIWLGGAVPNRFDAGTIDGVGEDGVCIMSPTLADGTVTDASAISYKLEAREHNPINWFAVDHLGIVAGTAGGEWLISASQLNDPLTPTSIQARQITFYKCADIEPRRTGISLVFVQRFKRRIMELLADVFTGRFVAPHLTEAAKHLTAGNVEELGYQEELAPILWMRKGDGTLAGATYRRVSAFTTEAPAFCGFHRHDLGSGRKIESIAVGPSVDGSLDSLMMVTNDPATNVRWVEMATQMFDEDDVLLNAWFVDGGITPDNYYIDTVAGISGVRLTGLWYLSGQTVSVFICGLDVGDIAVDSSGTLFVPFGSGVAPTTFNYQAAGAGAYLFTQSFLNTIVAENFTPRNGGIGVGISSISAKTVATNPNTTSKIQSFVPGTNSLDTHFALADWATGKFIASFGNAHPYEFLLSNGTNVTDATTDTMSSLASTSLADGALAADGAGNFFWTALSNAFGNMVSSKESDFTANYVYGTSNVSGPPSNPSVAISTTSSCYGVLRANSTWVVAICTGAFGGGRISLHRASDGTFIAGNSSTNPAYEGLAGAPWNFSADQFGMIAVQGGTPTHGGNIGSGYIASAYNHTIPVYFVGVADGVPTGNDPFLNPGGISKGGLLHLKKVANPASVGYTPSVDTPITDFQLIGTVHGTDVNAAWTGGITFLQMTVDQSDNGVIIVALPYTGGMAAYSSGTTYASGDIVVSGSVIYTSLQAGNLNHTPASNPTWWLAAPTSAIFKVSTGLYSANNTGSFAVQWAVPFNCNAGGIKLSSSQVKGGLFGMFSLSTDGSEIAVLYLIDTTTGKYSVFDVPGVTLAGGAYQIWDDQSQSIIFNGNYDSTKPGAPTALNSTVSGTNLWFRLYVGTDLTLSPNISSTTNVQPTGYTFVTTTTTTTGIPAAVGKTFTSEGQILRAIAPDQAGARLGPAFGTTRRTHKMTVLAHNAMGVEAGTSLTDSNYIMPWNFKNADGTECDPQTMFSGMERREIEADDDFDNMLCWRIVRPYPATIVSVGAKQESEDV